MSFPYDPQVVAIVKSMAGRQFDEGTKRWSVPLANAEDALEVLRPLGFEMTPRMQRWWGDRSMGDSATPQIPEPQDGYTVSQLNAEARQVVAGHFEQVWLVAEVDEFDRNRSTGHAFFALVERSAAGKEVARVRAVCFARERERLHAKTPQEAQLRDGARLRVKVRVELYVGTGSFQVIVEDIDAEWVLGARRRQRDVVLDRLRESEIADRNTSLPMPLLPLRVGLITSVGSDAYSDFCHELERSGYGFDVVVANAVTQGRNAPGSIVAALRQMARRRDTLDVVVITRGGGASGDLQAFDDFALGRAVCLMPVKVVVGIGHHRDRSVLDFVAASQKTPTAAAQTLVARVAATQNRVNETAARFGRASTSAVANAAHALDRRAARLGRAATDAIREQRRAIDRAEVRVHAGARQIPHETKISIESVATRLQRAALEATARSSRKLERAHDIVRLSDPRRIVEKGFAIVRGFDGRVLTSAAAVEGCSGATLHMRDGTVRVTPTQESTDE